MVHPLLLEILRTTDLLIYRVYSCNYSPIQATASQQQYHPLSTLNHNQMALTTSITPYELLPYQPTPASPLKNSRDSTAYSPNHSTVSTLSWWEGVVQEVCRASDLAEIRNVLGLFPAPNNAAALLSKRGKTWLTASLHVVCGAEAIEVPAWNSLESLAQAIVDIITRRRWLPPWNIDWIISDLKGATDPSAIATKLYSRIDNIFSNTTLSDWVALYLGHPNSNTNFLKSALNLRDGLILYATDNGSEKLSLLQKLLSQQPLLH